MLKTVGQSALIICGLFLFNFGVQAKTITAEQLELGVAQEVFLGPLFKRIVQVAITLRIPKVVITGEGAVGFILAVRRHLQEGTPLPREIAQFIPKGAVLNFFLETRNTAVRDEFEHYLAEGHQDFLFTVKTLDNYDLPTDTTADTVAVDLMPKVGNNYIIDILSILDRLSSQQNALQALVDNRIYLHRLVENDRRAVWRSGRLFCQSIRLGLGIHPIREGSYLRMNL
ncbi:MAG: hypothetical protein WCG27_04000, partial [Pseudomonadota bacterium]